MENSSISSVGPHDPVSEASFDHHIGLFFEHSVAMLAQLQKQNQGVSKKVDEIYGNAIGQIKENQKQFKAEVSSKVFSKKDIKDFKKKLKEYTKQSIQVIQKAQLSVLAEGVESRNHIVTVLAKGGLKAQWMRFKSAVFKTDQEAIQKFDTLHKKMTEASQAEFSMVLRDQLDEERFDELDRHHVARRAGVIGIGEIYRFGVSLSEKGIKKQLESFSMQRTSNQERTTLTETLSFKGKEFSTEAIPLNREFDSYINKIKDIGVHVFGPIFGKKGISSANRIEEHLINAWASVVKDDKGDVIFHAFRHAIIAGPVKGKWANIPLTALRAISSIKALSFLSIFSTGASKFAAWLRSLDYNNKKAATELLQAVLLKEIAQQGLTLEEAQEKGVHLNLNSVSLITPDDFRGNKGKGVGIAKKAQDDELAMLEDQVSALKSFNGKELMINGKPIKVSVQTNAFNFGVNRFRHAGVFNQYEFNRKGLRGLSKQLNALDKAIVSKDKDESIQKNLSHAKELMKDINHLMRDETAYLEGGNQYEIGAKILNLTNLMDQIAQEHNKTAKDKISGFSGAFNCKSGKDRTGIMDGVAEAFAVMANLREGPDKGRYYSHEEFNKPEVRQLFLDTLLPILAKHGIKITELNTDVEGYKVGEEARLFGMKVEDFLNLQRLGKISAS